MTWYDTSSVLHPIPINLSVMIHTLLSTNFVFIQRVCNLSSEFPSSSVWKAYNSPDVDSSKERFQWGKPDLDLIRRLDLYDMEMFL